MIVATSFINFLNISIIAQKNGFLFKKKMERKISSLPISFRPEAICGQFDETTSETDICGATQIQRKITIEETTSEILHLNCYI